MATDCGEHRPPLGANSGESPVAVVEEEGDRGGPSNATAASSGEVDTLSKSHLCRGLYLLSNILETEKMLYNI
jgi:hypothetical protein